MNPVDVLTLAQQLTDRDIAILHTLRAHRLATTAQLQRWHFASGTHGAFEDRSTALRVTQRVLRRLEAHHLIARLTQRIGGVRRGSDSTAWQLAATGDKLLSVQGGERRRRYVEPRQAFIAHTVAVTELAVRLIEAHHDGRLEQLTLVGEPTNWRRFIGLHGRSEMLKPDLHAITAFGDYEDHWLLERDLATEHPSVVVRKAHIYERYAATGRYQDQHDVFPAVLWVVPDQARQHALQRALRATRGLSPDVHRVVTEADFVATVLAGNAAPPTTHYSPRTEGEHP
ncbi:replication-relaxation family protein [Mycobacteroides abscessus]|uniref:replication-relaxation family protein n=1 Tax=Mycobacteroides abscessus TaxID=36809 RepID=UPI002107AEDC|nr:replication-relaxation family protein [Mycobacteroides abscessus]